MRVSRFIIALVTISIICVTPSLYAVEKEKGDSVVSVRRQEMAKQKVERAKQEAEKAKADSIDCPEGFLPGNPRPDEFVAVEKIPEMITSPKPEYPRSAKKAGVTGKVWLKCLVDESGDVLCVRVEKSSGSQELDQAAKDAAWDCKFRPGIQMGIPIRVWVTYPVEFRL